MKQIKEIEKAGGEVPIELLIERNNVTRELTESKRQLNNFLNTGDTATSRLKTKFDDLGDSINNNINKALQGAGANFKKI